jgi:hypothetical protein
MTRLVALVVLAIVTAHAHAAGGPALEAPAPTYDAGTVAIGTSVRHTYELRNTGTTPLALTVKASCGCTTTDFDPVIPPGGTGHLTASLDTRHLRGPVTKKIHVTTDDPAQPAVELSIQVRAVGVLEVLPTETPILRRSVAALRPMVLFVSAPDDAPFTIPSVEDDPVLRATVEPADPPSPEGHRRYRVILTPKADLAIGTYKPLVTLVTTVPKAERFALKPTIVVAGPLSVWPWQLRIRSCTTPAAVRITKADGTFKILGATVSDHDFVVDTVPEKNGQAWDVTLRYVGKPDRHGPVNAAVTITTDEPLQPTVTVGVGGELPR